MNDQINATVTDEPTIEAAAQSVEERLNRLSAPERRALLGLLEALEDDTATATAEPYFNLDNPLDVLPKLPKHRLNQVETLLNGIVGTFIANDRNDPASAADHDDREINTATSGDEFRDAFAVVGALVGDGLIDVDFNNPRWHAYFEMAVETTAAALRRQISRR